MPEANPSLNPLPPETASLAALQAEVDALRLQVAVLKADLTQQARREEERQRHNAYLLQSQKRESLSVLAGGIAHDFNNLLTIILGNVSLLEMTLPAQEEQESPTYPPKEYLDQVSLAAGRAAELCQQMLAYSGRGHFSVVNLDLNTLLVEMRSSLESSISPGASLHYRLNPVPAILADRLQMRQMLSNLFTNASEALEDRAGQIAIGTQALLTKGQNLLFSPLDLDLPAGNYVVLEVTDTGCGIAETIQSRIFDPFFSTKFTGRGLGLAAVLGIVRGHHSFIEFESLSGRGTTFRVYFPVSPFVPAPEQGQVSSAVPPLQEAEADWHGQGKILLVDDEEEVRGVADHMLRSAGFQVQQAASGADALAQLRQPPKDLKLVLLDLTMPEMDGVQTFRLIRTLQPRLPVILMSGYSKSDVESQFSGDRPADFLQKPFGRVDLLARVRQALLSAEVTTG